DIHYRMQKRLHEICVEKGVRDKFLLIGGGTQVKNDLSKESGIDRGFGRGSKGINVASWIVQTLRSK
ncbi:MAG: hypothetical protein M0Q02_03440, partial [Candidatus Muirbacterium halophilum]|nr:hypothetical protein [Candidatus Muirbacterium halophilum]